MLPDVAGDKLHSALRGEGDTFGGGRDEDGLALMKGKREVFVFMVGERTASFNAHHDKERVNA